jgi:hypothetical protein
MQFIDLPTDIHNVLLSILYDECITSFLILKYVNKYMSSLCDKEDTFETDIIASRGYFNVIKWAHGNGFRFSESTISEASKINSYDTVKYIIDHKCQKIESSNAVTTTLDMSYWHAINNNNFQIFELIYNMNHRHNYACEYNNTKVYDIDEYIDEYDDLPDMQLKLAFNKIKYDIDRQPSRKN